MSEVDLSVITSDDDDDESGLSAGAIAGIAVGCVAVVGVVAAVVFFFLERRRTEEMLEEDRSKWESEESDLSYPPGKALELFVHLN